MKELYLNAEMELVEFSAMDVIVTSPVATEATEAPTAATREDEGEGATGWT